MANLFDRVGADGSNSLSSLDLDVSHDPNVRCGQNSVEFSASDVSMKSQSSPFSSPSPTTKISNSHHDHIILGSDHNSVLAGKPLVSSSIPVFPSRSARVASLASKATMSSGVNSDHDAKTQENHNNDSSTHRLTSADAHDMDYVTNDDEAQSHNTARGSDSAGNWEDTLDYDHLRTYTIPKRQKVKKGRAFICGHVLSTLLIVLIHMGNDSCVM